MFARSVAVLALALPGCAPVDPVADVPRPAGGVTFAAWQDACAGAGEGREAWTAPAPPFRVHANTWYVGTCGIAALLVVTDEGNVLVDSGMPEAAPLVLANLAALGVRADTVRAMLSSHEHLDHVGATAALQRAAAARVVALDKAVWQMESGKPLPEDPQAADIPPFEGVKVTDTLRDGDTFTLGGTVFTAHSTPTHTPGSTSWTWQSCQGGACRTIAYADSLSTPAAAGYRFADHPAYVAQVRTGFARVAALPCDILVTPHPGASQMQARFAAGPAASPEACRTYAEGARAQFEKRLAEEAAGG